MKGSGAVRGVALVSHGGQQSTVSDQKGQNP